MISLPSACSLIERKVARGMSPCCPGKRASANRAHLLGVEDLHWSDVISLEFLHYLARRCATHPLLLLLTYRSDEVRPSLRHFLAQLDRERLAQECTLARLTREEVEAMLRA